MSGGFPIGDEYCNVQDIGAVLTGGTSVTGAVGPSYGAWTQLVASTTYDIDLLDVELAYGGTQTSAVDIGIGASGSEVPILTKLGRYCSGASDYTTYNMPISIIAGTRIAARVMNGTGSSSTLVKATGFSGTVFAKAGFAGADALGLTNAYAPSATSGGTVATKGSYTQVIASTSKDYGGLMICPYVQTSNDYVLMDIAIGASGSEQNILSNYGVYAYSLATCSPKTYLIGIPSGSRLSFRCSYASNTSKVVSAYLYGLYQ